MRREDARRTHRERAFDIFAYRGEVAYGMLLQVLLGLDILSRGVFTMSCDGHFTFSL